MIIDHYLTLIVPFQASFDTPRPTSKVVHAQHGITLFKKIFFGVVGYLGQVFQHQKEFKNLN